MENLEFTDNEIRDQLAALGYFDVSQSRLKQFRKDLQHLVEHDRSSGSSSWFTAITSPSTNSDTSPSNYQSQQNKVNLSRYRPHVQVSPQADHSLTQTGTRHNARSDGETSSAGEYSPETRVKTVEDPNTDFETMGSPHWTQFDHEESQQQPSSRGGRTTENDTYDDTLDHPLSIPVATSPAPNMTSEKRIIRRRKVVRRQENGTSAVFDESLVADSENGSSYRVHDVSVDDMNLSYNRVPLPPQLPPRPQSAKPTWRRSHDQDSIHEPLPSYIRPNTSHPHTRNIKKTDPVNRFHQYKDAWNAVKAPGEKRHSALRWEVKAQMMFKDEPQPKPQRTFVPNTYVVPTSKKRSALRWEVRHALERGLPVPSTFTVL